MASTEVPELAELEAVVMDRLWCLGSATVRQVLEALNETEPRARAYTTVMTIMRRLHAKGMLIRERRDDRSDVYAPAMTRAGYAQRWAGQQAQLLVDRYGDAALAAFADQLDRHASTTST